MKRTKHLLPAAITLLLILTGSALAQSQQPARTGIRGIQMLQLLRHEKLQLLKSLNLTPEQKAPIKSILESQKSLILIAARDLVKARLDLANKVPGAELELEKARISAAKLKKELLEQIKPILNSDQLAVVQQRMQKRAERLQRILNALDRKINL
jgi:hypothetical protein